MLETNEAVYALPMQTFDNMTIHPEPESGLGLLSQTILSSTCTKSVLPARIRSALHNDIIFVGHSSIHFRESLPDATLSDVLAHLELGIPIFSAKVVSADAEAISMVDAIFENGKDIIRYMVNSVECPVDQPPQIVVLSLASQELMFVYAKTTSIGSTSFMYGKRNIQAGPGWNRKFGRHLAVDPQ